MKTNESQTMSDEEIDKSSWARFWRRHGVNPNLLMLKVTLFVMHGGERNDKMYCEISFRTFSWRTSFKAI